MFFHSQSGAAWIFFLILQGLKVLEDANLIIQYAVGILNCVSTSNKCSYPN